MRTILQQIVSEGENGGKEDEEVEGEAAGGQQEMVSRVLLVYFCSSLFGIK